MGVRERSVWEEGERLVCVWVGEREISVGGGEGERYRCGSDNRGCYMVSCDTRLLPVIRRFDVSSTEM